MNRPSGPARAAPARDTVAIGDALHGSETLARLSQRLVESQRRLADIAGLLPPGLREQIRSGPLDDAGWTLLAANSAAAAKLRNLLPLLTQRLQSAGWPERALRVKTLGTGDR